MADIDPNDVRRMLESIERIEIQLDELTESVELLEKRIDICSVVLLGDEKLNVKPLRPMVDELTTAYSRLKWVAGTLATSNVGTVAAWISTLIK